MNLCMLITECEICRQAWIVKHTFSGTRVPSWYTLQLHDIRTASSIACSQLRLEIRVLFFNYRIRNPRCGWRAWRLQYINNLRWYINKRRSHTGGWFYLVGETDLAQTTPRSCVCKGQQTSMSCNSVQQGSCREVLHSTNTGTSSLSTERKAMPIETLPNPSKPLKPRDSPGNPCRKWDIHVQEHSVESNEMWRVILGDISFWYKGRLPGLGTFGTWVKSRSTGITSSVPPNKSWKLCA